jgi:hypothetical protein
VNGLAAELELEAPPDGPSRTDVDESAPPWLPAVPPDVEDSEVPEPEEAPLPDPLLGEPEDPEPEEPGPGAGAGDGG